MITALLSLSLLAATPLPDAAAPSITVSFHDLNLQTKAGRAELDRRLDRAVRAVCPAPGHRELRQAQAAEACRAVAVRSANQQRQVALASAIVQIGSSGR